MSCDVQSEQKLDGFEHSCLVERGSVGDALEADLQATVLPLTCAC